MPIIAITGAASGLGASFLSHYSQSPSNTIIAIDRAWPTNTATTFSPLFSVKQSVHRHTLDIADEGQWAAYVGTLQTLLVSLHQDDESASSHPRIDEVIHSAGIRGLDTSIPIKQSSDVAAAETLSVMTPATMMKAFQINAVGTFLLAKYLSPFLRPPAPSATPLPSPASKVMIMGSRMGSISSNVSGSAYAYRASKAALNAIVKSLSIDIPGVCFVVVHPGRVATELCDGVREEGAMECGEVVPAIVELLDGWQLKDSGRFVDRLGEDIGW
jgi:NAD(P)-dependent dehydrogenase (short-subunit alcohol dehydrogenase family)